MQRVTKDGLERLAPTIEALAELEGMSAHQGDGAPMRPAALEAYQWPPSTEVIARRVGLDPRSIVRFDGNVAAAPPPSARPAALARALAEINEYERGRYLPLRSAIADYHGLDVENVALGAGSDEFIVLLAQLFARGGTIATVPTLLLFDVPLRRDHGGGDASSRTPRRPTSSTSVDRTIRPGSCCEIPDVPGQIVIDEAYAQYAGVDALDRIADGASSCCAPSLRPSGSLARASATPSPRPN